MELDFGNFSEINTSINRCVGITKNGKKCRTRLRKNQYLFCCEDHKPFNQEIISDGCFCCTEMILNHKDALFFKCKHLVHKSCYLDWAKSESNTYENPICILCRNVLFEKKKRKKAIPYQAPYDLNEANALLENQLVDMKIHDEKYKNEINKFTFSDSIILF